MRRSLVSDRWRFSDSRFSRGSRSVRLILRSLPILDPGSTSCVDLRCGSELHWFQDSLVWQPPYVCRVMAKISKPAGESGMHTFTKRGITHARTGFCELVSCTNSGIRKVGRISWSLQLSLPRWSSISIAQVIFVVALVILTEAEVGASPAPTVSYFKSSRTSPLLPSEEIFTAD